MIRLVLALAFAATGLMADELPALFRVVDVNQGDVLNIRSAPTASSDIIGGFRPTDTGIEVATTESNGKWGRVITNEGAMGWVAMRYLNRMEQHGYPLSQRIECFGTEPFWNLALTQDGQSELDADSFSLFSTKSYETGKLFTPAGQRGSYAFEGRQKSRRIFGVIHRQDCSDGMSDMIFGLSLDLITVPTPGSGHETRYLRGCCELFE